MRTAGWLPALLCLALAGCSVVCGTKLLAPTAFGLERVTPELYVQAGTDAATRESLRQAMERARAAIHAGYGGVASRPIVHACVTDACYEEFGGMGSVAKVYGDRILVSPRGLDWHFIAHEWSHAELHERLGFRAALRVPQWFDEGVAVALSEAPQHSEAHWRYLADSGVRRPSPVQLREFRTRREWLEAVGAYGEAGNAQRRARGEPEIRPVYAAAGRELRPWLRQRGAPGLLAFIAAMRAGEPFEAAWLRPPP